MRFGRRHRTDEAHEPSFGERPTVAVITVTRNEGDMLRLWCEHYARHVGHAALLIFDDNSTDGSTDAAAAAGHAVHRIPGFPGGAGFERARIALVSDVAAGLLHVYDYVVFVDVDEFLVPDPTLYADLPAFLAAHRDEQVVGAIGLNLVHAPDEEPLDLRRPILEQRSYASFSPLMCKPSTKRVPAPWADSSHGVHAAYRVAPDLYLLHLKFADRDRLRAIGAERHGANQADGRAGKSSWSQPGNKLVAALRAAATPEAIAAAAELDTGVLDLDALVLHEGKTLHRAPRIGQLIALRDQPVVRVPARLRGAL